MPMKKQTYFLASLGCAKNSVDSDSIAVLLEREGFRGAEKPNQAEVLIVNTCGFIQQARDESIEVLRELSAGKKSGQILIAAGCLSELFREKLTEAVPGLDGIISTRRWMDIVDLVDSLRTERTTRRYHLPESPTIGTDENGVTRASIQGASAYLKIADGCRRPCAYCSIPLIKGPQVSRPQTAIIDDARRLQDAGIRELILIAQDTTDYGSDLGMKDGLVKLLENLLPSVPDINWVRLMYAYPGYVSDPLIDLMSTARQILPYLDIPLQHASPAVLKAMKRPANMEWVRNTLQKMRERIPGLALRTTFITGFPAETEKDYQTLLDFVAEIRFDHMGVFPYSFELGTSGAALGDPIPADEKKRRVEGLMKLQETISMERNQRLIGKSLDVLVEGYGDGVSVGRSYRDAPEIDGLVLIEDEAEIGQIVPVKITSALVHDLIGRLVFSKIS